MEQFSEEDIHYVCGVLETNGFDVATNSVVTLYDITSMIEHCCSPNTTISFNKQLRIIVRAAIDIPKGHHITGSYIDPFQNERIRQTQLAVLKFFDCTCFRCQDPTDLGTHMGSLKCFHCKEGIMRTPTDIMSDYICLKCHDRVESVEVEQTLAKENDKLLALCHDVRAQEKYLKETRRYFTENHYLRFKTKMTLFPLYGECEGLEKLALDTLEKKIRMGEELLSIADKITPGNLFYDEVIICLEIYI